MAGCPENQELSKAYDNRFSYPVGCRIFRTIGYCKASQTMREAFLLTEGIEQLLCSSLHQPWSDRLNASSSLCTLADNCGYENISSVLPSTAKTNHCMIGVIYNPLGAWLHDRVNSRRWMFMVGTFGCLITTSGLAGCIAQYSGTTNKAGNAAGVFFVFLYLAFQG